MEETKQDFIFWWAVLLLTFLTYATYMFYQTNVRSPYLLTPSGMECYKIFV